MMLGLILSRSPSLQLLFTSSLFDEQGMNKGGRAVCGILSGYDNLHRYFIDC